MYSFNTARKYAMEYGTFLGMAWVLDFLCITSGMNGSSIGMIVGGLVLCTLWIFPIFFAFRFKQHLPAGEHYPISIAIYFTIMMFVFAEVLSFMCEYAYFEFFDHGHLIASIEAMMEDPAIVDSYKAMGMSDFLSNAKSQLAEISGMSSFDMAMSLMGNNILTSIILFIPTVFFARLKSKSIESIRKNDTNEYSNTQY